MNLQSLQLDITKRVLEVVDVTLMWVVPCIMLTFLLGYLLGRALGKNEREATLKSLKAILASAQELSDDMDSHNTELASMTVSVQGLDSQGLEKKDEVGNVQDELVGHIKEVVDSNRKLEDDLVCARYALEEQAQELDRTRHEAYTDNLSGIPNRKAFDDGLGYWLSRFHRKKRPFTLLLIDIDHFKWINDTHGHQAGDLVVRGVGDLLQKTIRKEDMVARYGGDEFAVLLANNDLEKATEVAENLRRAAEKQNFQATRGADRVAITFSIGLSITREGDTRDAILRRTDCALYAAKEAGRNCVRYAQPEASESVAPAMV